MNGHEQSSTHPHNGTGMPGRQVHVLLLEDSVDDAEIIVHELVRAGFAPVWRRVDTAEEFIAAIDGSFDLVLSDYDLPQYDGLAALAHLRASKFRVPFLLITGSDNDDLHEKVASLGGDGYVLKNRLSTLGDTVRRILSEHSSSHAAVR